MSYYTATLSNIEGDFTTIPLAAGAVSLALNLSWDSVTSRQYDTLNSVFVRKSAETTMMDYSRNREWYPLTRRWQQLLLQWTTMPSSDLAFWTSELRAVPIPMAQKENYTALLNYLETPILPDWATWRAAAPQELFLALVAEIQEATSLETELAEYRIRMVWSFSVQWGNDLRTGIIQPGCWIYPQWGGYNLCFASERTVIGHDDLNVVQIIVELPD